MKEQKSDFWIWTTLWLTTLLDIAIIYLVLVASILFFIHSYVEGVLLTTLDYVLFIISIYFSSWVAVSFVLKRSIVQKVKATSFAFKTMMVPVTFTILGALLSVYKGTFVNDFLNIRSLRWLIAIVGIFLSVRYLISKKGD
ncbi:hypothetical protein HYS99_00720 [Candidatus Giovannonibacteria bacterium]|nr:hypothetical protein [Candidatus Giovannonibacteria bacterium]